MAKLIEVKGVSKSFTVGDSVVQALRGVDLTVEEGEYVAVLGPSGSGKSTLMNVLGCMDNVQAGEYFLAGLPIHKMKDEQLTVIRNRMIGFIFQRYHLVPTYNVLQNVMMPMLVRGASHREAQLAALEGIAEGVPCSEIDRRAREVITAAGYGQYFTHSTGHGVGYEIHEAPTLSTRSADLLKAGDIVTVEPGIYLPAEFGVRIEDSVIYTEEGYENLCTSPKNLIIL